LETLLRRKRISTTRLPHLILDQLLAFSYGRLNDDVAILALRLTDKTTRKDPEATCRHEKLIG
jgi:hypothetical protein